MTMTPWLQYLETQSATIINNRVSHFSNDLLEEKRIAANQPVLCDLSQYHLIQVSGDDAQNFLQNQFCNDVMQVNQSQSQLNAYCNPKGRVLAFFRLLQNEQNYFIRLPGSILEPTLKRLRMFVMMSKVKLDDVSHELVRIGYAGASADKDLRALLDDIPEQVDAVTHTSGVTLIRCNGDQPRYEITGPMDAIQNLWTSLAAEATPIGSDVWEWLEIHAGIPEILPETVEAFVPQMINLKAINALSFKKGCYPGQEIVARMHYLGKLKRRMYLAHVDTDQAPAPGSALVSPDSSSGQGVGKVVRAQASPEGGVDLLAVIEIASADKNEIRLENQQGALMNLQNLPYMLEETSTN